MAKQTAGVWGIDLGQCALKAIRVQGKGEQITATAFDYIEHPKILSQPDADPDQLMREALEKFLSRNTVKGDIVAISVPGQSGLARFVKLPPVEEKKIADIVRFEAKQQIPFSLDEVVWDFQKIGAGTVTDGFAMDTEIGLFAMKRDKVNTYLEHFKEMRVEVHVVQMAPLALCNYIAYDLLRKDVNYVPEEGRKGKRSCVVGLEIGTDSSNLVITDGEKIIWQRPIPFGGNHFTRALTKDPFKLTFAKAEHLKKNATKSGPDLKKILSALKPVLNDFVGEAQRSLGYFTNTHRDAQVEYMIGLGNAFRLPGLQRFLGEKLQLDVRKLQKFDRLAGEDVTLAPAFTENVMSFGVAYGLAVQGLAYSRLQTNLLPHEIRTERLIRAKKPWASTAAAVLLLGLAGSLYGTVAANNQYNLSMGGLKEQIDQAAALKSKKAKFDGDVKMQEEKVKGLEDEVKSLNAGERVNWLFLNRFISRSLPRPELKEEAKVGLRVSDISPLHGKDVKQTYWTNSRFAKQAHQEYLKVQLEGKPLKEVTKAFTEEQLRKKGPDAKTSSQDYLESHLLQVSIEAVDARYTPDLAGAWKNAEAYNLAQQNELAKKVIRSNGTEVGGKGWIIELRGYTFHDDRTSFVVRALIENLAEEAGKLLATASATGTTPANPATPVTPPGTPADPGTPAAPGTPGALPTVSLHPIEGKITHVILLEANEVPSISGDAGSAGQSRLPILLTGLPAGGAGPGAEGVPPPPPPDAPPPDGSQPGAAGSLSPLAKSWQPLAVVAGAGTGGAAPLAPSPVVGFPRPAPAFAEGGEGPRFPGKGGPLFPPTAIPPRATSPTGQPTEDKSTNPVLTRTEFVICFIWKPPQFSEEQIFAGVTDTATGEVWPAFQGKPTGIPGTRPGGP